jgi:hypothetical protein
MAVTYKLIETITVGSGGAATIEFTSIPQTYTDLVLLLSCRSNRAANINDGVVMKFNGNSLGYSERAIEGNGSAASSFTGGTTGLILNQIPAATSTASVFSNNSVYIPNYSGSTNKSISIEYVQETNATTALSGMTAALWSNTAAITSIALTLVSGTLYLQHSSASLYGIKNS